MDTRDHLNTEILKVTLVIKSEFPELIKYLNEMPDTFSNEKNPEIDIVVLEEYYNSLYHLLKKYAPNHISLTRRWN